MQEQEPTWVFPPRSASKLQSFLFLEEPILRRCAESSPNVSFQMECPVPSKLKASNAYKLKGTAYAVINPTRMTTAFPLKLAMGNTLTTFRRDPNPFLTKILLCCTLPRWLVIKTSRKWWRKKERILFDMWVSTSVSIPGTTVPVSLENMDIASSSSENATSRSFFAFQSALSSQYWSWSLSKWRKHLTLEGNWNYSTIWNAKSRTLAGGGVHSLGAVREWRPACAQASKLLTVLWIQNKFNLVVHSTRRG